MFADLKVATLIIHDELRNRLIKIICDKLNAYAEYTMDYGQSSVEVQNIATK